MNNPDEFLNLVRKALNVRDPELILDPPPHYRHAGILIPLFVENGTCQILFTKRSETLEHHKGQISFPGGAIDEEDESVEETALRESYEEIGLLKEDVEILGRVDDVYTGVSDFVVHPLVGIIPGPYDFKISEAEVERIIKVPWDRIVSQHFENRTHSELYNGDVFESPEYEYQGDVIWGATAKILKNLIEILYQS